MHKIYYPFLLLCLFFCTALRGQEVEKAGMLPEVEALPLPLRVAALSQEVIEKDKLLRRLFQYENLFYQNQYVQNFPVRHTSEHYRPVTSNLFLSTWYGSNLYPALGGITSVDGMLTWTPNNHFIISGGMYVAKAFYHPSQISPVTDGGVNMDIRYLLNDRLSFHAFGTYSVADQMDQSIPVFFPQNILGGGARYMFNENFGLEGGVIMIKRNGKMRPNGYVTPVIKAGNVRIEMTPSISMGSPF